MENKNIVVEGYDYRLDNEPRALYHWEYRKRYKEISTVLSPNQEISLSDALSLDVVFALIGNNQLIWNTFDLRKQDREPVEGVIFSGKSCHIDFTDSDKTNPRFINMNMVCDAVFGRECARRTDHLYIAQPADLAKVEVKPFWLPLPNHPLHIRLVHGSQIKNPFLRDLSRKEKEAIASIWKKIV